MRVLDCWDDKPTSDEFSQHMGVYPCPLHVWGSFNGSIALPVLGISNRVQGLPQVVRLAGQLLELKKLGMNRRNVH